MARPPLSALVCAVAGVLFPAAVAGQADTVSLEELRRMGEVDSAYASPELRAFVARAAEVTGRLPELLRSYRADVESEISIVQGESTGREVVLQVEQIASDFLWRRNEPTVQRVVGYRARSVGPIPSLLTMFEVPWVVPTLYGDRIDVVRWSPPRTDAQGRVLRRRAIHPLAPGRDRVYRFTGGDTVLVLRLPDRTIPLVRVEIEPVRWPDRPTLLFEGWMDIDATRHQIVRMRGRMISADPDPSADERILGAAFSGATFVEFQSAEYDERFWLPRWQRIEVQAVSRLTDTRVALRVVSSFDHPDLNETGSLAALYPDPPPGGLLVVGDAVRDREFGGWRTGLGELTGDVNVQDFRDLEPERARTAEGAWVGFGVRHLSHLVRLNEPEGVFTGIGLTLHPGPAWKEGRVRLHGGWAWSEKTVRGGLEISHLDEDSRWEFLARAERLVRPTGDFGLGGGGEVGVPPLVSGEHELLYDHRVAGLVARQPRDAGWSWRLEAGRAADAYTDRQDEQGGADAEEEEVPGVPLGLVAEGAYWLGRATLERSPGVTGFGVIPGTAVRLHAEGATGDLDWVRLEGGASVRRVPGSFSLEGRLDAGATFSDAPPPQRLFELGRYQGLTGYPPRAFAGDRVALAQAAVAYTLPLLRRPWGVGGFYLPAVAPAPAVILRAGWTDASADAAAVLEAMGARTTGDVRTSLDLRLRLFGGGLSLGFARPLEEGGDWRFVWSLAGGL